ncbi:MAG: hypothetical protein GXO74_06730 [Calditrichaeota bacterium]|nr:hypothetical protein [Calditrichota bacterium]
MSDVIAFRYRFTFEDDSEKRFTILLDAQTLDYIPSSPQKELPAWTKLQFSQCENCPLKPEVQPRCPIAVSIVDLFEFFKSVDSYDEAGVEIETPQRTYFKMTTVQRGLGSMLGIFMVTSGCPVMEVLKPMVRFHLPFASIDETVFRSVGSYLIGQYFLEKSGRKGDFELRELRTLYLEIQKVNSGIVRRLRPAIMKDALANAVISLDAFAKELPWSIEDDLEELQHLYTGYFQGLFPF